MQKQYDSLCLLFCEGAEILWKFHSGLRRLIIIVCVVTCNVLAKVTSLHGARWGGDRDRNGESVKGGRDEDGGSISNESWQRRWTYRFDGILVDFGFCLPQMMPIYWEKEKTQGLVQVIINSIINKTETGYDVQMMLMLGNKGGRVLEGGLVSRSMQWNDECLHWQHTGWVVCAWCHVAASLLSSALSLQYIIVCRLC